MEKPSYGALSATRRHRLDHSQPFGATQRARSRHGGRSGGTTLTRPARTRRVAWSCCAGLAAPSLPGSTCRHQGDHHPTLL